MEQKQQICFNCKTLKQIKKSSTSNALRCSDCNTLIGFFIPRSVSIINNSEEEYEKKKTKDISKTLLKLKHQILIAEQALTKLEWIFLSLNYTTTDIISIKKIAAIMYANCSKIWHENLDLKRKSFHIPKSPDVRLSACIIYTLQHKFEQKASTQNLVNIISSHILSCDKNHDQAAFQSNVYHFIGVMQRFMLYDIDDFNNPSPSTSTSISSSNIQEDSITKHYINSIEVFNEKATLGLPDTIIKCIQYFFDKYVMFEVCLAGKGPKLAICASIYHILFDHCPLLAKCFTSKNECLFFISQLQIRVKPEYLQNALIHFYLIDLKKKLDDKIKQTKLKSLQKAIEVIKHCHCPKHSWE